MKSEAGTLTQSPRDARGKITLVARPLQTPFAQKLCKRECSVLTRTTCVHSRTLLPSKSFAAVREAMHGSTD
jgi:hypothetical protein